MRARVERSLGFVLQEEPLPAAQAVPAFALHADGARRTAVLPKKLELPPEYSWREYAVFLLHVAAEIEHALMIQYLYAAYSLGGSGLSTDQQALAGHWRTVILGIAKEEMGHFVTVQNLL